MQELKAQFTNRPRTLYKRFVLYALNWDALRFVCPAEFA
jgi:hypothetical protein